MTRRRMPLGGNLVLDLALVPGERHGGHRTMQDPLPEQVELGAPVPYAFEELHRQICPSHWPVLQGVVSAAMIAA